MLAGQLIGGNIGPKFVTLRFLCKLYFSNQPCLRYVRWAYFPIQSECRKIRTRKSSVFGLFFTQRNLFRSINFCSQYQITIEIRALVKQIGGMGGIASNPPIRQANVLCNLTGFWIHYWMCLTCSSTLVKALRTLFWCFILTRKMFNLLSLLLLLTLIINSSAEASAS